MATAWQLFFPWQSSPLLLATPNAAEYCGFEGYLKLKNFNFFFFNSSLECLGLFLISYSEGQSKSLQERD